MRGLLAVPACCPRCDRDLAGAAGASFLVCPACGEAREVGAPGRVLRIACAAAVGGSVGPVVPFFRFTALRVRARALAPEGEAAAARLADLRTGYVVATRIRGFHTFGDIGLEYTRRPPRLETGPPIPALDVTRRLADAEAILRLVLWRIGGEQSPPFSFAIDVEPGEPELWCVPTLPDGSHVKFPHASIRYPAAILA